MEEREHTRKRHRDGQDVHVSPPVGGDDEDGHLVFAVGDYLTDRYKILSQLGQGTFGKVVECRDCVAKENVAIKIVKNANYSRKVAMGEIRNLELIANDEEGRLRCVQMKNSFDYRDHKCIVFEKLGQSLYDCLRKNIYNPFPLNFVREFGRQILESVACLHDIHLIHTDLKTDNILLVSSDMNEKIVRIPGTTAGVYRLYLPKSSAIKLIDFGNSVFDETTNSHIVSSRPYRAPEVILGVGWSFPCDLWSVGCILVALCFGKELFHTTDNLEHLAMMERVLGRDLPSHMMQNSIEDEEHLKVGSRLNWPAGAASWERCKAVDQFQPLNILVSRLEDSSSGNELANLLNGLLKLDPAERLTARQALDSPFFKNSLEGETSDSNNAVG